MDYQHTDFNGASNIFGSSALAEWQSLHDVLSRLPFCLQPSEQAGKVGEPIFDPKATNANLTSIAAERGWTKIAVPSGLELFGSDWDGGRAAVLAEWQFSNYPFLWNNVIRSEAVFKSKVVLDGLDPIIGLVIVTKTGALPASNSTLYYEQACAQLNAVTEYNTFEIPIRVVGLFPPDTQSIDAIWTEYPGRYSREGTSKKIRFEVQTGRASQYGIPSLKFSSQ